MRVLWLNHRDPTNPRAGGAERTIREISSRLSSRGHSVTLVCGGFRGSPTRSKDGSLDVFRIGRMVLPHFAGPILGRKRFDVVVDDLAHVVPWLSPWLIDCRGTVFFRHLHRRTLSGQVPRMAAELLSTVEKMYPMFYGQWPVITESTSGVSDLISLGFTANQVKCIPPGVDLQRFVPGQHSAKPRLLYFGGMRDYKRPDHAVLTCKKLSEQGIDVELVVVGDGPAMAGLQTRVREWGMSERVHFTGRLTDEALAEQIRQAWVNIHCSTAEGWCYSAMEAASSGVPTVAYKVPGLSESVTNGVSGLLVRDGDTDALASAVLEIVQSPDRWWARTRSTVSSSSWELATDRWEDHFRSISVGN